VKKVNKNSLALRSNSQALLCIFPGQTATSHRHYTRNARIIPIGLYLAYRALPCFLSLTTLLRGFSYLLLFTPLSLTYRALAAFSRLHCFTLLSPAYRVYRAFSRFTALYPNVKLICFILLYANPFAFSPPYAKLPYNFCLVIFFLYLSLRVFIAQIFSYIASTFHNLYASLCPASLKPFRSRSLQILLNLFTFLTFMLYFFTFHRFLSIPFMSFLVILHSPFPPPPAYYNFTQKITSSPLSQTL
jgi:hypothetical protein